MELMELWDKSRVPLFDMNAKGYYELARIESFDNDIRKVPGYINSDVVIKYKDADVEEITWHNCGIGVKFYKGDEDDS